MPSLCDSFRIRASATWDRIREEAQTGIRADEEALTANNLHELQKLNPQENCAKTYSKHREARTGADWEWWVASGGQWLGLLVQAKRLDPARLEYTHLDH